MTFSSNKMARLETDLMILFNGRLRIFITELCSVKIESQKTKGQGISLQINLKFD